MDTYVTSSGITLTTYHVGPWNPKFILRDSGTIGRIHQIDWVVFDAKHISHPTPTTVYHSKLLGHLNGILEGTELQDNLIHSGMTQHQ